MKIKFVALHPDAKMPVYGSEGAAGADLCALRYGVIAPGDRMLVKTGVSLELPPGTWGEIKPRSGLALKLGIQVMGGVIDNDYRGDIGVILHNTSSYSFYINPGDRIAQLVISNFIRAEFETAAELEASDRGAGGFGSTGVSS